MPTEIDNFHNPDTISVNVNENIVWLEIEMKNAQKVCVTHSHSYLLPDLDDLGQREFSARNLIEQGLQR